MLNKPINKTIYIQNIVTIRHTSVSPQTRRELTLISYFITCSNRTVVLDVVYFDICHVAQ